jgi:hypothetical protein
MGSSRRDPQVAIGARNLEAIVNKLSTQYGLKVCFQRSQRLISHADYVIVENPARFTFGVFFHSKLPDLLERFNAPTIQISRITQTTIAILDDASKQLKKALTFREAEPVLEIGSRFELEHWRNRLFAQFEDIADLLLQSPDQIQRKIERPKQKRLVSIGPYDL